MFTYPLHQTPAKRQQGVHALLDPEATSDSTTAWDDAFIQQSYLPGRPHTPAYNLVSNDLFNASHYDNLHIQLSGDVQEQRCLPISMKCASNCDEGVQLDECKALTSGGSFFPVTALQQSESGIGNMTWSTAATRGSYTKTSLCPSTRLSVSRNLDFEHTPESSFLVSSSYYDAPPLFLDFNEHSSDINHTTLPSHYVLPSQTVANPRQLDANQSMCNAWINEISTDGISTTQTQLEHTLESSFLVSSSYYDAPPLFLDFNEHSSDINHTTLPSHYVLPSQTVANPRQLDANQSMCNAWINEVSTDGDLMTKAQFASPDSSAIYVFQSKTDPLLSAPELQKTQPHSPTRTKTMLHCPRRQSKCGTPKPFDGRIVNGSSINSSIDEKGVKLVLSGAAPTVPKKYLCQHCNMAFGRSEHKKRHMMSHLGARSYPCPTDNCRAVNRNDNAYDHAYTHVKAWFRSREGALERSKTWVEPLCIERCKSRNSAMHPAAIRDRILKLNKDDPKRCQRFYKHFDRKASNDFEIHVDFEDEKCKLIRCYRKRGGKCPRCR
ncbi:hypothetical protein BDV97DRAFT_424738 [Delphinella strobiligena]|nr:hypothetical protein BDV97DRAFT_424738 [Delphinella strobiligena]